MNIALIGNGAIANYVQAAPGSDVRRILVRPERLCATATPARIARVEDLPSDIDLVVECAGGARLHLATGASGALDCLQAARIGILERVTYGDCKPPAGWRGSPALLSGEIDLVVGRLSSHRHRDKPKQEKLFDNRVTAVVGNNHPLTNIKSLPFDRIKPFGWILPPPETTLRRQIDQFFINQDQYAPPVRHRIRVLSCKQGIASISRSDRSDAC